MKRNSILLICFLLAFSFSILASPWMTYKTVLRLENNDGLSNSSINDIFQDSDGRIWIATWDGLNSYNGERVETYRPHSDRPASISYHVVRTIAEDQNGALWIATDFGINRMNRREQHFESFFFGYRNRGMLRENSFHCAIDTSGGVWAAVFESGLYRYSSLQKDFVKIEIAGVNTNQITHLKIDRHNQLWISTNKEEVIRLSIDRLGNVSSLVRRIKLPSSVRTLLFDGQNTIWLQLFKGSCFRLNTSDKGIAPIEVPIEAGVTLHAATVVDSHSLLATSSGLLVLSESGRVVERKFKELPLFSLLFANNQVLWLGSDSQGILCLATQRKPFQSFSTKYITKLENYPIRAIEVLGNSLFLGTKGAGLLQTNLPSETGDVVLQNRFSTDRGLPHNSILALAKDGGKGLFVGTDDTGLFYLPNGSKEIVAIRSVGEELQNLRSIYALLPQSDSVLWVGTSGNGLFRLLLRRGREGVPYVHQSHRYSCQNFARQSINNDVIYSLCLERDSLLWIATRGGGLNCLRLHTGQFEAYRNNPTDPHSLSSNDAIALLWDRNQVLWVGTGSGLNRRLVNSEGSYEFVRFGESNGLPNATIHALQEDACGSIWASTNNGLFRLNPHTAEFNLYDYKDGLQNNEFSDGASFALRGGSQLFFGGIKGLTTFDPHQIHTDLTFPPFQLDDVLINNQQRFAPLPSDESYLFNHDSQYLSFRFSIFDYLSNAKCKISYKLTGGVIHSQAGNEWIDLSTREIILSNLAYGDYSLYVRYSNSDNRWNPAPLIIRFRILPPWWLSSWAIGFYALFVMAITYWIFASQRNRLKLAHRLQLETFEKDKSEEIHQAKLRFFTNIAHEFSNSITLIYAPSERLLAEEGLSEKSRSYLTIIRNSARRMQTLIQQLMEFRKAETGHLALHYERVDVRELIRYTADNFLDQIDKKNISLTIQTDDKKLEHRITDRDALEKIIFNLFSNACKYTPERGYIQLFAAVDDADHLLLRCTNSGKGIEQEDLRLIFNRFKVLDSISNPFDSNVQPRTGIGLALCQSLATLLKGLITVESEADSHTTFTLSLPPFEETVLDSLTRPLEVDASRRTIVNRRPQPFRQGGKSKIVVVDDDADIRFFLRETLSELFDILEAGNGKEAFELIRSHRPQLIVTDIVMPIVDGIELVQQLKEDARTQHIPIVILSSKVSLEDQIQGLNIGAVSYINKPFHPDLLIATINALLGSTESTLLYSSSPQSNRILYGDQELNKEDFDFITQVLTILARNISNEEYNQEMIANEFSITKVQFYRRIKRITGRTPSDFIRSFRFQEVAKLLTTTNRTVQEIMFDCGFGNKAYFFREFAKIYGTTPKEYRKRNGE